MRTFIIEQGTERVNGEGGLALAGLVLRDLGLDKRLNGIPIKGLKGVPEISNADVVRSYVGLLCMGRTAYEEIELYRENDLFRNALGIKKVPSCETLRQRFDGAEGRFDPVLREIYVKLLSACLITPLKAEGRKYMPLDVDVTPFDNSDSHKENVSRTYKGCDGFAPIFAHIGEEGHILDCELRPGKQHSQRDTPEFLRRVLGEIDALGLGEEVLFRLDSGFDCQDNITRLHGRHKYIIKRNLRKESPDEWLKIARIYGRKSRPREGKTVYVGECRRFMESKNGIEEPLRIVFEVTVRTITAKAEVLLLPEIEVNTWWTNLPAWPETVIKLYHAHGTRAIPRGAEVGHGSRTSAFGEVREQLDDSHPGDGRLQHPAQDRAAPLDAGRQLADQAEREEAASAQCAARHHVPGVQTRGHGQSSQTRVRRAQSVVPAIQDPV